MPIQSQMGQLFDTFYDIFLSKSPDVPPKFAHTDFERQQQMLKESRLQMLLLRRAMQDGIARMVALYDASP